MNQDLSNLISELREQVLYLQELGVDSLNADLPEIRVENRESKVENPKTEFVVPDKEILKMVAIPLPETKIEPLRNNVQGNSRLSNLPKLSDFSVPKTNQPIIQPITQMMPKKSIAPGPTESLFGDISQSLPESTETLADIRAEIGKDCYPLHAL